MTHYTRLAKKRPANQREYSNQYFALRFVFIREIRG